MLVIGLVGRVKEGTALNRSRIVNEDVEAATEPATESVINRRNLGLDPFGTAEVSAEFRLATSFLIALTTASARLAGRIVDDHRGTFSRETDGGGGTDTAG